MLRDILCNEPQTEVINKRFYDTSDVDGLVSKSSSYFLVITEERSEGLEQIHSLCHIPKRIDNIDKWIQQHRKA